MLFAIIHSPSSIDIVLILMVSVLIEKKSLFFVDFLPWDFLIYFEKVLHMYILLHYSPVE